MDIKPLNGRVVVELGELPTASDGGLLIPDIARGVPQSPVGAFRCKILAVASDVTLPLKPGQTGLVFPPEGCEVRHNKKTYFFFLATQIMGVLED